MSSISYKYLAKVRPFLASKTVDMLSQFKEILNPEACMIHIGIYHLTIDKTPDEICSEILRLIKELKTDKNKTVV